MSAITKPKIFRRCIGRSVEHREINACANFDLDANLRPANATLLIGGMHGDEKATIARMNGKSLGRLADGQSGIYLASASVHDGETIIVFTANDQLSLANGKVIRPASHWDFAEDLAGLERESTLQVLFTVPG